MENWIKFQDNENNFVLSSRIRLARNIKDIAFPHKLDIEESKSLVDRIEKSFYHTEVDKDNYETIHLWNNNKLINNTYLEKHLISNKLLANNRKAAFLLNKDETISIMINEEDHIRIQCITSGLNLKEAFKEANIIDDILEKGLDFAFHENLGYLTACPTNSGTGLRASVMLHLPALSMEKRMDNIFNTVSQVGMTIRGLYGEGSKVQGNIYQISNQITLGLNEEEIINNLNAVVNEIINRERISRERIMSKYKYEVEDKIYRSLGILKYSVMLNSKECLELLSNVRLGVELGIVHNVNTIILNELLVETSDSYIQTNITEELSKKELDIKRAEIVKKKLINK